MKAPSLLICRGSGVLAAKAADIVAQCAKEAIEQRGRFTLVLSGGSTPEKTYRLLAEPGWSTAIIWPKTHIFFGDERFVPPGHEYSNYGMARRTLLTGVPVPPLQVFPVPTQGSTAAEAAARYGTELARFFSADAIQNAPPRFDLILLGLGEDGHTASLLPGAPALRVDDAWVTWSRPGGLPPPVDRITLTYPVLNAARHVVFLVSGANKAAALRNVLESEATCDDCPAAGVRPADGTLAWLVDEEAAKLLTRQSEAKIVIATASNDQDG
jgi:6-phosphogluconolactonase